jgi:hypothetical protein
MFVHYDPVGLARGAAGGVAIALVSSLAIALTGRVAGMSGIVGALTSLRVPPLFETAYTAGLLSAGAVLLAVSPPTDVFGVVEGPSLHWAACVLGGLAVGFGARLGSAAPAATASSGSPVSPRARSSPS